MQNFNNKVAVITGGASGVGRALARQLAREGARVVVADIEEPALNRLVDELRQAGHDCLGHVDDLAQAESVAALAEAAFEHYGAVHLVFANAGVGTGEGGNLWEYDPYEWEWGFRVNTCGLIHTINAFLPRLIRQNLPAYFVVTGTSNGAILMLHKMPNYTTTKDAAHAITETLLFQLQAIVPSVQASALFPAPHVDNIGIFNSERNRPED